MSAPAHKYVTLDAINHAISTMDDWQMRAEDTRDIFDALYDAKVTVTESIQDSASAASALVDSNVRARHALRLIEGGAT